MLDARPLTGLQQGRAQGCPRLCIAGVQLYRLAQHADSAVMLSHVRQSKAYVTENVGILVVQGNGPFGRGERFLAPTFAADQSDQVPDGQDEGQVGVSEGQVRVPGDLLAQQVRTLAETLLPTALQVQNGVTLPVQGPGAEV